MPGRAWRATSPAFARDMKAIGCRAAPHVFHSNGGLLTIETASRFPVRTCVSGPAAGVIGAAAIGAEAGFADLVTFDVGGTSTDVSLIEAGRPAFTAERIVPAIRCECRWSISRSSARAAAASQDWP